MGRLGAINCSALHERHFGAKVYISIVDPTEKAIFLAIRAYVVSTEIASRHNYSQLSSMKRFMSKSGSGGLMRPTCS